MKWLETLPGKHVFRIGRPTTVGVILPIILGSNRYCHKLRVRWGNKKISEEHLHSVGSVDALVASLEDIVAQVRSAEGKL